MDLREDAETLRVLVVNRPSAEDDHRVGSWRELIGHLGVAVVLAGGVLLGAINIYLTASMLPTMVADIGGERLYAWTATVFLSGQVLATMLVSQTLSRLGNVASYLVGFGVFTVGSAICAVTPTMPVLLVGRGAQGVGSGLLVGLGFALIHSTLPTHLWVRGSALVSAMFGVGNLVGPAVGGLLAQFGSWRIAFAGMAIAAAAMAAVAARCLPRCDRNDAAPPPAMASLGLMLAAIAALSVAGIVRHAMAIATCIAAAVVLVLTFLVAERRTASSILPKETYQSGSALRWVYLTMLFLASAVAVETFLPLFGQKLGNLQPAAAGVFAALLSLGWSVSQIASSAARRASTIRRLQLAGPAVLAAAFAVLIPLQVRDASLVLVVAWGVVLLLAGVGIGIAMPHLSVAAMSGVRNPAEADKAGASIATVLTMSTAFGSALAGFLVNIGTPSTLASARHLLLGMAATAALGVLTALPASRVAPAVCENRSVTG